MAFIPKKDSMKVGDWVQLTANIEVMSGTFTRGTQMLIVSEGERGFDLRDREGNYLRETILVQQHLKKI
jgi:hypothetical protein